MKKLLILTLALLLLLPCLAACRDGVGDAPDTADESEAPEENIVRPPVRNSKNPALAHYALPPDDSIESLFEAADVVARIKITNWLGDSGYIFERTNFETHIIEVYKGDTSDGIIIAQSGTTVSTMKDHPLFTYGNEMILFLQKMSTAIEDWRAMYPDANYPDYAYENAYQILGGPLNIWNVGTTENGDSFVVPYFSHTRLTEELINTAGCKNYGSASENGLAEDASAAVKAIHKIDGNALSRMTKEYVFALSEFEDYIKSFGE